MLFTLIAVEKWNYNLMRRNYKSIKMTNDIANRIVLK